MQAMSEINILELSLLLAAVTLGTMIWLINNKNNRRCNVMKKSKTDRGIFSVFVISMLGFILGNIGVVMFDPKEISTALWMIIALSALLGLSGMLMALAAKLLTIIIVRVSEDVT